MEWRENKKKVWILRVPFPSDLNTDLGGRKRRKSKTEAGLMVLLVCSIACGLVSNKVKGVERRKKEKSGSGLVYFTVLHFNF